MGLFLSAVIIISGIIILIHHFYSELLQWWDDFRNAFSTLPLTAENIIWNNKLIKIDGKSIYYHNYIKAGILLTNQMQFDKGSLESYNIATNAGLKQSNFLTWAGIRSAIPGHLKFLDVDSRKTGLLEFCCGEKTCDQKNHFLFFLRF